MRNSGGEREKNEKQRGERKRERKRRDRREDKKNRVREKKINCRYRHLYVCVYVLSIFFLVDLFYLSWHNSFTINITVQGFEEGQSPDANFSRCQVQNPGKEGSILALLSELVGDPQRQQKRPGNIEVKSGENV